MRLQSEQQLHIFICLLHLTEYLCKDKELCRIKRQRIPVLRIASRSRVFRFIGQIGSRSRGFRIILPEHGSQLCEIAQTFGIREQRLNFL